MTKLEDLQLYERLRMERLLYSKKLSDFVQASWPIIEPAVTYEHNWHIDAISEHLEAVKTREIKRLIINMPPRHAKSTIISVDFPAWVWASEPGAKFICGSYAMDLSLEMSRKRRMIIESDWYAERWGDYVQLANDQNAKGSFVNSAGGSMTAVSTGSPVTGKGANYIISDDPHNVVEIGGKKQQTTKNWFNESLSTRLNDARYDCIVVVMQRLHQDDIVGMLLEMGGWENLILPAEYEGSKYFTSIGWSDPRTVEGEPLWKNRITTEVLDGYKKTLGAIGYAGQFQQRPVPQTGGLVKSHWLQHATGFYDNGLSGYKLGSNGKFWFDDRLIKFITVDLAITKNETSDYTVISVWAISPESDLILIDIIRDKLNNPEQIKAITAMNDKHTPAFIAIEAVAYQLAIVQQLMQTGLPVRAYKPGTTHKEIRFMPASVYYENGKIYHLTSILCLTDIEQELLNFPLGTHDDFCDTVSMAVSYIPNMLVPSIANFNEDTTASVRHILDVSYKTPEQIEEEVLSGVKSFNFEDEEY